MQEHDSETTIKQFFKIIALLSLYDVTFAIWVDNFQWSQMTRITIIAWTVIRFMIINKTLTHSKAFSELCETSKMERLARTEPSFMFNRVLNKHLALRSWNFKLLVVQDVARKVIQIRQSAELEWKQNRTCNFI